MSQQANYDFTAAMNEAIIPTDHLTPSVGGVSSSAPKQEVAVTFNDGYVPIPIETVLKPACMVSKAMSFGDLYSSLVCIDHKDNITSVMVSTGQAFFRSSEKYVEGVEDFRVYIQVPALQKAMALAGSHIGMSEDSMSLGFWDLFVPIQSVTDGDDLRKHFAEAEACVDHPYLDVEFPFSSMPSNILGLYSSALVTLQNEGIVWFSSEHKHFVNASFPYNIALHLTTVQVLRSQNFKKIFLEGDKLYLKTEAFTLCVPTFKIEQDLFKTTFAVPVLTQFTPLAPVQMATMMKSAELFSGSVRFHMFSDGAKASISAISDEKVLFSVPLLLSDASIHFDFSVTAEIGRAHV